MKYPSPHTLFFISTLTILAACGGGGSSGSSGSSTTSYTASSAEDDFAVTVQDQATTIAAADNDHANEASSFRITAVDATTDKGGSVALLQNGTLEYTPASEFIGNDFFSYEITDNRGSTDTANVYVNVRNPELPAECAQDAEAKRANGEAYCVEGSIESFDGTTIAFQLFVPPSLALIQNASEAGASLGPNDEGFAPLLIHAHGFGDSKTEEFLTDSTQIDKQISYDAWQAGNWVISYTQRGFGGGQQSSETASGGAIGMMNPALEGLDFVRLVDWAVCHLRAGFDPTSIDANTPADPEADNCGASLGVSLLMNDSQQRLSGFSDNPSLGTIGYSYGGAAQFNAQSVDTRVDAMVPMGTWFDLRFSLHPNDAPKTSWIEIMTAFALQGGNGEPLPELIIEGNQQANTANLDQNDDPHNKQRQVSVKNHNILGANGTIAYCDGNQLIASAADTSLADQVAGPVFASHPFVSSQRQPRADMLMIQGHGDTLFNMNEGYDNARCFASQNPQLDVRYISQTSGHPLPDPVGPPHYAGQSQGMYLDEIVHCGLGIDGQPKRYNLREVGFDWLNDKLRGVVDFDTLFPHKLCITQANTHPELVLDTSDPFFDNGTSNSSSVAYQFPREGLVANSIDAFPIGAESSFEFIDKTLVTGPNPNPDGLSPLTENDPLRQTFIELYEADASRVLAGIPLATLNISRDNPFNDELFYVGVAVQRCHINPFASDNTAECDSGATRELLQFQAMPIRVFPTLAAEPSLITERSYPASDPRNSGLPINQIYSICWGGDPGNSDNPGECGITKGRLIGITTRLHPGDKVGLMLMAEHPVFTSLTSPEIGQISVSGEVWLPLQAPSAPPATDAGTRPNYIIDKPATSCPALDPDCSPVPLAF